MHVSVLKGRPLNATKMPPQGHALLNSGSRNWNGCCDRRLHEIPGSISTRSGDALACRRLISVNLQSPSRPLNGLTLYRSQYEGSAVCSAVRNATKLLSKFSRHGVHRVDPS